MAERKVTVRVDLVGGGNLQGVAQAAAAQVARLQQTTKGATAALAQLGGTQARPSPTAGMQAAAAAVRQQPALKAPQVIARAQAQQPTLTGAMLAAPRGGTQAAAMSVPQRAVQAVTPQAVMQTAAPQAVPMPATVPPRVDAVPQRAVQVFQTSAPTPTQAVQPAAPFVPRIPLPPATTEVATPAPAAAQTRQAAPQQAIVPQAVQATASQRGREQVQTLPPTGTQYAGLQQAIAGANGQLATAATAVNSLAAVKAPTVPAASTLPAARPSVQPYSVTTPAPQPISQAVQTAPTAAATALPVPSPAVPVPRVQTAVPGPTPAPVQPPTPPPLSPLFASLASAQSQELSRASARLGYSQSAAGEGHAHALAGVSAAQRSVDAEQRLAFLRSGPGQAATVRALRAEADLARQQDYTAAVARRGRFGAGIDRAVEATQPVTRTAAMLGAAGLGTAYAGIASVSPEASSQITNSFRMIANEIGIATIPAAVRFTGVLQQTSRAIRGANEATGGWAGNVAFTGSLLAAGVGAAGYAMNLARSAVSGIQWGSQLLGLGGQAAASTGGQLAGQTIARTTASAGSSVATSAASSGAGTLAGAGAASGTGALSGLARGGVIGAAIVGAIDEGMRYVGTSSEIAEGRGPANLPSEERIFAATAMQRVNQVASYLPAVTGIPSLTNSMASIGNRLVGAFGGPGAERYMVPTHGVAASFLESVGIGRAAPEGAGGLEDVTERNPRIFGSAEELQQTLLMRTQATPGPLGAQEARAIDELVRALNRNSAAMESGTAASTRGDAWAGATEG